MQRINELYNQLIAKNIQGGHFDPPINMPNFRFIFDNPHESFDSLSICVPFCTPGAEWFETLLKKGNKCVCNEAFDYDSEKGFESAYGISEEIKRLVEHLKPNSA